MERTNRRDFLRKASIGAAAASAELSTAGLVPRRIFAQESSDFRRIVYRKLGSTGFQASEIGFGCMNMREPELLHAAIDQGINYIDTANVYMNGVNEEVVGSVMKTKRDKVFLTTKVGRHKNLDTIEKEIETSLKRLQLDHVDLLLFHVITKRDEVFHEDYMRKFENARKKGQTRFIGISVHGDMAGMINAAVETKFWEAVLTGYNYYSPPELIEAVKNARTAGLATIGMKNLITMERPRKPYPDIRKDKSGNITNQQALLRWVMEDRFVDTTIPGITSFEQLEDDIDVMGLDLTFDDRRRLERFGQKSRGSYCSGVSGCTGCQEKCPKGVEVCEINRCVNYAYGYGDVRLAHENYDALPASNRLSVCDDCDVCTVECINGLDLTENIKRARELFA